MTRRPVMLQMDPRSDHKAADNAVAGEIHPFDPTRRTRLQIGHIIDKSMGGGDDPTNLRAICSVCNEGARNLTLDRPSLQKLLIQVRRATGGDQVEVLRWLIQQFPKQTAEILTA